MSVPRILALGFFDGVHLGHQALLKETVFLSEKYGFCPSAMTFDVHPDKMVTGSAPHLLNTAEDRKILIKNCCGIGDIITYIFTKDSMQTPWRSFLDDICCRYNVAGFVVGYDFSFGWKGEGNAQRLRDYCTEHSLLSSVIPAVKLDNITVSSTVIRSFLEQGELEKANLFLGHSHFLSGIANDGIIKQDPAYVLPRQGDYRVLLSFDGGMKSLQTVHIADGNIHLPSSFDGPVVIEFSQYLKGHI